MASGHAASTAMYWIRRTLPSSTGIHQLAAGPAQQAVTALLRCSLAAGRSSTATSVMPRALPCHPNHVSRFGPICTINAGTAGHATHWHHRHRMRLVLRPVLAPTALL
jgi:hypothetical protein